MTYRDFAVERCPFCGSLAFAASPKNAWQVWCSKDLCARGPIRATENEAIRAWNERWNPVLAAYDEAIAYGDKLLAEKQNEA